MPRLLTALVLACVTLLPTSAVAAAPDDAAAQRATSRTLAFQPDGQTTSVLRLPAGTRTTMHRSGSSVADLALSRDGSRVAWVYYANERIASNRIMVRGTGGKGRAVNVLKRYPRRFDYVDTVGWSPTGRRLAFIARTRAGGSEDLWTIRTDGRGLTKVRRNVGICPDGCGRVLWAPDGRSIAWQGREYIGGSGWRRLTLATKRVRTLPDGFFGWSDDMKWIGRLPFESSQLVLTPTGGGAPRVLEGPLVDEMGGRAPSVYFGAGSVIAYRTDEVDEDDEPSDRYVAVSYVSGQVMTLTAADPERGGPFDFR